MPDYLITWIHLAAAITLIGGLMFSQFVLTPVARKTPSDSQSREVVRLSGRRFRTIAWVSLIILILTGAYQMLNESGAARIETTWGVVLMLKLLLFVIAKSGCCLIHDFIIDPYALPSQDASPPASSPTVPARADTLQKAVIVMTLPSFSWPRIWRSCRTAFHLCLIDIPATYYNSGDLDLSHRDPRAIGLQAVSFDLSFDLRSQNIQGDHVRDCHGNKHRIGELERRVHGDDRARRQEQAVDKLVAQIAPVRVTGEIGPTFDAVIRTR